MPSIRVRRGQWVAKSSMEFSEGSASADLAAKCKRHWGDHRNGEPWNDDSQNQQDAGALPEYDDKYWAGPAHAGMWKGSDDESWYNKDCFWYEGDASGSASGDDAASGLPYPDTSSASTSADSQGDAEELTVSSNASDRMVKSGRNKISADVFSGITANNIGSTAQEKESEPGDGEDAASAELKDGVEAGRKLLSMLMEKAPERDAVPRSEPQPLSTDEFQLWAMQAREDAEIGADVLNAETFGEDSGQGWSFEENLAANEQITERMAEYREELAQAQARAAAELASFYDYGQGYTYEEAMTVQMQRRAGLADEIQRLDMAISKAAHFMDLKPACLNEAVRMIIYKGWEDITWRNKYTALHFAAELGHAAVMPLLVALCADPDDVDTKGRTALDVAEHYSHWGCVMTLTRLRSKTRDERWVCLSRPSSDSVPTDPASPLVCHYSKQQMEQASTDSLDKELRRLNVVLQDMSQFLKIEPWCLQEVVQYMTTSYLYVDARYQGRFALHMAAEYGRGDVLFYLLLLRADPCAVDAQGRTALDVAACSHNWGCARMLRLFLAGHSYIDIAKLADCSGEASCVMGQTGTSTSAATHVRLREMRPPPR